MPQQKAKLYNLGLWIGILMVLSENMLLFWFTTHQAKMLVKHMQISDSLDGLVALQELTSIN